MEKALWNSGQQDSAGQPQAVRRSGWCRRMSDHIAYALLGYTGLQIYVTISALKGTTESILPFFALVVLVAAVIPGCRLFERRWERLSSGDTADEELAPLFRRDRLRVWIAAIGLPFLVAGIVRGIETVA